ncbi:unnamed protein product [Symbiodinium sp. CCMP2592]|nr:unnamed protein product [Symbiodinium sp. CCMP2592]
MLSYRTYNSEDHKRKALIDSKWYRCRKGHELRTLGLPYLGVTCSLCGRVLPSGSCLHSCSICKWDACTDCLQRPESARSFQSLPNCPVCGDEMEWSDYMGGIYVSGWACENQCGSRRVNCGLWRWFCQKCKTDICDKCHRRKVQRDRENGMRESPRSLEFGTKFLDLCKDHQWEQVTELLQKRPGLVNCEVEGRWSALHYASRAGNPQMVEHLLKLSADATSFAGDGKTPLEVARDNSIRSLLMRSCFLQPAFTIFNHYDANNIGVIDAMELGWVVKSVRPRITDAETQQLFASCDSNRNGEIDFVEFVLWLFAGGGKYLAQDILASADRIASGSVGVQALKLKGVLSKRAGLPPHVYEIPEYSPMPQMAHHPPRGEKLLACTEYVQQLAPMLPGIILPEGSLEEVERIAQLRAEVLHSSDLSFEMICSVVMWTFDAVLATDEESFPKEKSFQYLMNQYVDQRDTEFFFAARGYFYYFMTALDLLPPAEGVVYQGIPKEHAAAVREILIPGTSLIWRSFTTALQLWGNMVAYEKGIILQITLLPRELRAKGVKYESKGRDISKLSALTGSSEVLLLPNIRLGVGPETVKKGIPVIELREMEEDTAITLNAEDFD